MDTSKMNYEELDAMIPGRYELLALLSSGCYGQVVQCRKKDTNEAVAIKLPYYDQDRTKEVRMLRQLMRKGFDKYNIVKYFETFPTYLGDAMVFEILDISLHKYLHARNPMSMSEIRPVIKQVAIALVALKSMGVIHGDLKLDNVMVVNPNCSPIQIKIIDFGMAIHRDQAKQGMKLMAVACRAPEIILRLPFSEAIDMWAFGVMAATMVLKFSLFPCRTEYETLKIMIKLFGQPSDFFLDKSPMAPIYFKPVERSWELMTDEEILSNYQIETVPYYSERFNSLEEILEVNQELSSPEEEEERNLFLNLLSQMFEIVEEDRITPAEIHRHPFMCYGQAGVTTRPDTGESDLLEEDEDVNKEHVSIHLQDPLTAVELRDLIPDNYSLVQMLEVGEFGQAFICKKEHIEEVLSVKLPFSNHNAEKEASVMRKIMKQGLDQQNIVKFYETIDIVLGTALVFEILEMSLQDYMHDHYPLPLNEVQSIIQQTASALQALKSIRIIHGAVNMDTIMLRKQTTQRLQVKLTNFASAFSRKEKAIQTTPEMVVQKVSYRAPEVILGLPLTEAIDVWSLGTVLANMILGLNLFPQRTDFETLKIIIRLFGSPSDATLDIGIRTHRFFIILGDTWDLMTNKEYEEYLELPSRTIQTAERHFNGTINSLADLLQAKVFCPGVYKEEEMSACIHLIINMLKVEQAHRIRPALILRHPFIYQQESCPGSEVAESESEEEEDSTLEPSIPRIIHVKPATPDNTTTLEEEAEANVSEQNAATLEADTSDTKETSSATTTTTCPLCPTDFTKKLKKKKNIAQRIFSWVRKRLCCIGASVKDE